MPHKTLTVGTPWRVILFFTVPLLIGNFVQQLYHVIDAMVVGNALGVNSLAAVGATGSLLFLLLGFAWGMTTGFAIPTAQAFGAGDATGVRRSVAAGVLLSAAVSLLLTIVAPLIARPMLIALQTPAELLDEATTFAVISFLGAGATMFFNLLSAIIRAIGDSRTPLVFLIIACGINIVLVLAFVAWLGYGVGGAALATVISQIISVLLCLIYLRRSLPALHVHRDDWRVTRRELAHHMRLGLPMGFQSSIIAIGTLAIQVRLNTLGSDAVAAYTTATRVDGLAVALFVSLGIGVSTYTAQNYGAGHHERIRQGVRQALWLSIAGSAILATVLIAAGVPIIRLFVGEGATTVVDMAHWFLITNGSLYAMLGILLVLRGALQGLGYTFIPTMTGVVELVMRVSAALVLGALFGFTGLVWGNPMAWFGAMVLLIPAWKAAKKRLAADTTTQPAHRQSISDNTCEDLSHDPAMSTEGGLAPVVLGMSQSERNTAVTIIAPDTTEPHPHNDTQRQAAHTNDHATRHC